MLWIALPAIEQCNLMASRQRRIHKRPPQKARPTNNQNFQNSLLPEINVSCLCVQF